MQKVRAGSKKLTGTKNLKEMIASRSDCTTSGVENAIVGQLAVVNGTCIFEIELGNYILKS